MPQRPQQIPSPHQWDLTSPCARTLHAPGPATPAAHGHLMAGSRTSFNGSLIIFSLNKGLSASSLLFHPARAPEKAANISAFPPRQPQSAQGDTVPAGKVNIICSYYLCCDSSQSPNRSPNAIALRLFTHTHSVDLHRSEPPARLPARKPHVPCATSPLGCFTTAHLIPPAFEQLQVEPQTFPAFPGDAAGARRIGFLPSAAGDG